MRIATGLALAIVVSATPASALLDDTVDALGIYFDQGVYDENCIEVAEGVPFDAYFVLGHCSRGTISGFEFAWRLEPEPANITVLDTILPPYPLNLGTPFNLLVGLGTPYLTSEATVLVTLRLSVTGATPGTYFQLGPATPASVPGHMAFLPGEDGGNFFLMYFPAYEGVVADASGWSAPGVATIGCPGPVGTEGQSWGSIKALYE